jgi:hypothetical protein
MQRQGQIGGNHAARRGDYFVDILFSFKMLRYAKSFARYFHWAGCACESPSLTLGFSRTPTLLSGLPCDLFTLGRCERIGPGATALEATLAAKRDSGLIFGGVFGAGRRLIFNLAGQNIADQLAELYGIAGAGKALCCHRGSMPSGSAGREWARFQTVPLPRIVPPFYPAAGPGLTPSVRITSNRFNGLMQVRILLPRPRFPNHFSSDSDVPPPDSDGWF